MSKKVFRAIDDNDVELLQRLVTKYPKLPEFTNEDGNTPIMYALIEEPDDVMEMITLLGFTTNPNIRHQNNDKECALHLGVLLNDEDVLHLLIDLDRDAVNIQNDRGETPLHLAVKHKYLDMVRILVMNTTPDVTLMTKDHKTAIDYAADAKMLDTKQLLEWLLLKKIRSPKNSPAPNVSPVTQSAIKTIQTKYRERMNVMKQFASKTSKYIEELKPDEQESLYRALNAGVMYGNFNHQPPFFFCTLTTLKLMASILSIIDRAPRLPIAYEVYRGALQTPAPALGSEYSMTLPFSTSLIKMYAFGWTYVSNNEPCCLFKIHCAANTRGILVSKLPWQPVDTPTTSEVFSRLSGTQDFHTKVNAQNEFLMAPHRIRVTAIRKTRLSHLDDVQKRNYVQHYLLDARRRGFKNKTFEAELFQQEINVYECSIEPLDIVMYRIMNLTKFNEVMNVNVPVMEPYFVYARQEVPPATLKRLKQCEAERIIVPITNGQFQHHSITPHLIPPALRKERLLQALFQQNTLPLDMILQKIPPTPKGSMRVASWNVHMWKDVYKVYKRPDMVRLMSSIDADVICLQEVQNPSAVPFEWPTHFVKTAVYGNLPFGNSIYAKDGFAKHPPQDIPLGTFQGETRSAIHTCIQGVHIYNLHLDVYDDTGKEREAELKTLLDAIARDTRVEDPVLICGDFNAIRKQDYTAADWQKMLEADTSRNVATRSELAILQQHGFESAFTDMAKDVRFTNGTAWSGRIVDFMFIRNLRERITQLHVIPTNLSDHVMIAMDIAKPKRHMSS